MSLLRNITTILACFNLQEVIAGSKRWLSDADMCRREMQHGNVQRGPEVESL